MNRFTRLLGLRGQMAISYVWVTVTSMLLAELLVLSFIVLFIFNDDALIDRLQQTALQYADTVSRQTNSNTLITSDPIILGNASTELQPGQLAFESNRVIIPYLETLYPDTPPVSFALLVDANGYILATSYPPRYPLGASFVELLPNTVQAFEQGKTGELLSGFEEVAAREVAWAVAPVRGNTPEPLGIVYLQVPKPPSGLSLLLGIGFPVLLSGIVLLIVIAPIGAFFGLLTTRGLVQRLEQLGHITAAFADGDLSQRLPISSSDEIGRVEYQFNVMADQLVDSIAQQKELVKQNASFGERARLSRELHDSISQDLFSLSMLIGGVQTRLPQDSPLQTQVKMLEKTVSDIIHEMRALLLALRPTHLGEMRLKEALEALAATYRSRLEIDITTDITDVSLNTATEDALFRIAQEALSNAVRHGGANHISLQLQVNRGGTMLYVQDNGKGFDLVDASTQQGFGLRLMHERLQELSGSLEIQTSPSQGTCLRIFLPKEHARV